MRKAVLSVIVIFMVAACGYFLVKSLDSLQKVKQPAIAEIKDDFQKRGTIAINETEGEFPAFSLVYEDPGAPALSVRLELKEQSVCGDENFETVCFAINQTFEDFFGNKPVSVEGYRAKDGSVIVSRIIRLRTNP